MTILIAEDDRATMLLVLNYLKSIDSEISVICVPDGVKACEIISNKKPQLVLLDWHMPKMAGIDVLRFMKNNQELQNIPVIMVTSVSMTDGIEQALDEGAIDYLSKPIEKTELLSRVKAVMKLYNYSQKIEQQNERLEQLNNKQTYFNNIVEKSKQDLQEVNNTKDKLFSIIAHDLKHPLAGIRFFSKMILEDFEAFTEKEFKDIITDLNKSFESSSELLNNLLEWSGTQLERINFEPEYLSLNDIVNTHFKGIEHSAKIKNIDTSAVFNQNTKVYADKNTVSLVVRNLLSNALKFTPENGKITIDTQEEKNNLKVYIRDTGVGIDEETLKKLFNIQYHITTRGTSGEKGTGLGLLLCQEFIKKNNGEIGVESKIGKGSAFWFTLPIQKPFFKQKKKP